MNAVKRVVCLALAFLPIADAQELREPRAVGPVGAFSRESQDRLNEAITRSAPDEIFWARMRFDQPVSLGQVRKAANQLEIFRVLAFAEYRASSAGRASSTVPFGLGVVYEQADAWQRSICRAQIFASLSGVNDLPAPESWSLREIDVHGTAHAVRELRAGTIMPPARVVWGAAGGPTSLEALTEATKQELAEKIEVPRNFTPPDGCRSFIRSIEAPVLSGRPVQAPPGDGRTDYATALYQQLAEYSPDTPVTLLVVFRREATVEKLAELVDQLQIDGMVAELMPGRGNERVIVQAELSIHAPSLEDQVLRTRCFIALANQRRGSTGLLNPPSADEWYARRAQVSVPADAAWQLVSHSSVQCTPWMRAVHSASTMIGNHVNGFDC
jgi:hypothetical protein